MFQFISQHHDIWSAVHKSIMHYFVNEYLFHSSGEDIQFLDIVIQEKAILHLGDRAEAWLHFNLKTLKVMMKNQLITIMKEFKNAAYYIMQAKYNLNPLVTQ